MLMLDTISPLLHCSAIQHSLIKYNVMWKTIISCNSIAALPPPYNPRRVWHERRLLCWNPIGAMVREHQKDFYFRIYFLFDETWPLTAVKDSFIFWDRSLSQCIGHEAWTSPGRASTLAHRNALSDTAYEAYLESPINKLIHFQIINVSWFHWLY